MTENQTRRGVLAVGSAAAALGAVTAGGGAIAADPAISPELEHLIEAHRAAFAAFLEVLDRQAEAKKDDDLLEKFCSMLIEPPMPRSPRFWPYALIRAPRSTRRRSRRAIC